MKKLNVLFLSVLLLLSSCTEINWKVDTDPAEEFSFVFMTDIHLQPERNATEGFKSAIKKVNDLDPDFVITGGDLIMDALGQTYGRSDSLYNLYTKVAEDFNMPVHNTVGNHEIYGWYERSGADRNHPEFGKKMFEKRIEKRYRSFDHMGWHFLILDSVEENGEGGYQGGIDSVQMEWIKQDLASVDSLTPVVVSTHIPFITTEAQILRGSTEANSPGEVIVNAKEVLKLFDHHNLKLVLQGHLHYLESLYVFGTTFITGGAVSARWWRGPYLGTEEGFLMIHVEDNDFEWKYVDYCWEVEKDQ